MKSWFYDQEHDGDWLSHTTNILARRMNRRGMLGGMSKGAVVAAAGISGLVSISGHSVAVKSALAACTYLHCYSCQSFCTCNDFASCYYTYNYCGQTEEHWGLCSTHCTNHYLSCNDCCRSYVPYGDWDFRPDYFTCPCWTEGCMC